MDDRKTSLVMNRRPGDSILVSLNGKEVELLFSKFRGGTAVIVIMAPIEVKISYKEAKKHVPTL